MTSENQYHQGRWPPYLPDVDLPIITTSANNLTTLATDMQAIDVRGVRNALLCSKLVPAGIVFKDLTKFEGALAHPRCFHCNSTIHKPETTKCACRTEPQIENTRVAPT